MKARNAPARATDTGKIIAAGDFARGQGRWDIAIEHYAMALSFDPANAGVRVQLGHGLKELGRLAEAEGAYRLAAAIRPDDADVHLQIGHVLKLQGRQEQAVEAYAEALRRDPAFEPARTELIAAGRRNLLPDALYGRSAMTDALTELSAALRSEQVALKELGAVSIFPIEAYDAFRHAFPIQPPRTSGTAPRPATIIIDAVRAHPALVRVTLTSLLDQGLTEWTAVVRGCGAMVDHAVASLAEQDDRIVFLADPEEVIPSRFGGEGPLLVCDAGVVFDPAALGWFTLAQARTNADLVISDHDHHISHWRHGRTYADPVLQGMPDPWEAATTPHPPVALLVGEAWRDQAMDLIAHADGPALRRGLLLSVMGEAGRIAHIPRLLCSVRGEHREEPGTASSGERTGKATTGSEQLIRVIVPTRDEPQMLKTCIDSLLSKASLPERVRIQVIDNRSVLRETLDMLRSMEKAGRVQSDRFDEPFNWARINNVATTSGADDAILVFANNDVEMLTEGWDERLAATLNTPGVGLVGVRLLYPDRTVQHAGIVLGVNDLRPVHEGLGRLGTDGGPTNRWRRARQAAAVTGAFMAIKHTVFREAGGFDERLAIGYNDVDLCLRVRTLGLGVIYEPAIELIHHESRTRGRQDDHAKVSWDDEELTDLHDQWGGWMMFDPGKNPQWFSTHARPFDGLRDLSRGEVLRHIDISARRAPWSIDLAVDPRGERGDDPS